MMNKVRKNSFFRKTAGMILAVSILAGSAFAVPGMSACDYRSETACESLTEASALTDGYVNGVKLAPVKANAYLSGEKGIDESADTEFTVSMGLGERLSGNNQMIYRYLKQMAMDVAEGKRTSTKFEIPVEKIGYEKSSWTASELGVSQIITGGYISDEVVDKILDYLNVDVNELLQTLLYDCPIELYWFDKIVGITEIQIPIGAYSDSSGWKVVLQGSFEFNFWVADEYAAFDDQEKIIPFTVDYNKNSAMVEAAFAKASEIVEKYKDKDDFDKLLGYKEEICKLADYNFEIFEKALDNPASVPFGNPWQAIWVFDSDDNTTVVCEGYAKAFQYLFNLSEFKNDISCRMVSGASASATSSGPHMWNVVTMEDGENYIVDVTNCDTGMFMDKRKLFLNGCDSGSISEGYEFLERYTSSSSVTLAKYLYDEPTHMIFEDSELTLCAKLYEKPEIIAVILRGDVNLDGDRDAEDLTILARHVAKIQQISDDDALVNANVDALVDIDAVDLTMLARHVAKIESLVD